MDGDEEELDEGEGDRDWWRFLLLDSESTCMISGRGEARRGEKGGGGKSGTRRGESIENE